MRSPRQPTCRRLRKFTLHDQVIRLPDPIFIGIRTLLDVAACG
jgi:hypothetical protein